MIDLFTLPFIQRAVLGGVVISLIASLIGILVVLKRSSFFGDTIAHASLAGVALGLLLSINPTLTAAAIVILIAIALPWLEKRSLLPLDNLLGFILPFSMAVGVLVLATLPGYQPELISFLFGNILTISWTELTVVGVIALITLTTFVLLKDQLSLTIFDANQAKISGINTERMNTLYSVLLALTIVVSIKLVGIVLVNALLVIPATTVRIHARSLKQMFVWTPIIALLATVTGLFLSFMVNLPSGPAITVVAGNFLIISILLKKT